MKIIQQPTTFNYDTDVKPFASRMRDLQKEGLVKSQTVGNLTIFKYSTKAFYSGRSWVDHPELMECRGVVTNLKGDPVNYPFRRVFNWRERGAEDDLPMDMMVKPVEKLNGFLLMAFYDPYIKDVKFCCSGTLEGNYVTLGENSINEAGFRKYVRDFVIGTGSTMIFEIIDSVNDPHIVQYGEDMQGPHLIGIGNPSGTFTMADDLQDCFPELNPAKTLPSMSFNLALELVRGSGFRGEGFLIQNPDTGVNLIKLKSPYYLAAKLLSRSNPDILFADPEKYKGRVSQDGAEELSFLVDEITSNFSKEKWLGTGEAGRLDFIRSLFSF